MIGPDAGIDLSGPALVRTFCDASLVQAGSTVPLRRDDLVIVHGPVSIGYIVRDAPPVQILDLGHHRLSAQIARGRPSSPTVFDTQNPLTGVLRSLWPSIERVQRDGLSNDAVGRQLIDLVVGLTIRLIDHAAVGRLSHYGNATLARAKVEIDTNFADPQFCVATLAKRMRLSSRRLLSLFAEEGTTTSGFIQERRLRHARDLLGDRDGAHRRIASIALASGFRDQAYFSRSFRRTFGATPKEYRDGCAVTIRPDPEEAAATGERDPVRAD